MKRQKIDLSEERRILATMIVDSAFLSNVSDIAHPSLFESGYAQIVAGWVLEFFQAAKSAPSRAIEDIYLRKSRTIGENDHGMIGEFLTNLSQDWGRWGAQNLEYSTKAAVEYFKLRSLSKLKEELVDAISNKDFVKGEHLIGQYRRIERLESQAVRILHDASSIVHAFHHEDEVLFSFPGAVGRVIGDVVRGDFIAFQAPPKRGKSWWLLYAGFRAAQVGKKALMLSFEMVENQMIRRSWTMYTGKPAKAKEVRIPRFTDDGEIEVLSERRDTAAMTKDEVIAAQKRYRMMARGGELRMEILSGRTTGLNALLNLLDNLEMYDNFVPDVLVLDYADLMKDDTGNRDIRHQIDAVWRGLRSIAQERNIAIITASQGGIRKIDSDRDATAGDVAEDARKLAHVTKYVLLNQTKDEKKKGIMRVTCNVERDGNEALEDTAVVLECRDIGRPYLDSRFKSQVRYQKSEDE